MQILLLIFISFLSSYTIYSIDKAFKDIVIKYILKILYTLFILFFIKLYFFLIVIFLPLICKFNFKTNKIFLIMSFLITFFLSITLYI